MVLKIFIFAIFLQHVLGNCPVGYVDSLDGSRCYKVMVGATNWFTAEKQCAELGGHLSSIGDAFTNKYLRGIAETAFGTDTTFWLGGIKWPDPINWIWSDYGNFSFVSWGPGITGTTNSDNEWAWIGLYRQNIQSPWQWIDGTAVDLTNWDTTVNPPTNNSDFLYAAINTYGGAGESELGKWTDAPIESIGLARAICKTPAFGLK